MNLLTQAQLRGIREQINGGELSPAQEQELLAMLVEHERRSQLGNERLLGAWGLLHGAYNVPASTKDVDGYFARLVDAFLNFGTALRDAGLASGIQHLPDDSAERANTIEHLQAAINGEAEQLAELVRAPSKWGSSIVLFFDRQFVAALFDGEVSPDHFRNGPRDRETYRERIIGEAYRYAQQFASPPDSIHDLRERCLALREILLSAPEGKNLPVLPAIVCELQEAMAALAPRVSQPVLPPADISDRRRCLNAINDILTWCEMAEREERI